MHKNDIVASMEYNTFHIKNFKVINPYLMPFEANETTDVDSSFFLDWKFSRPHPCEPQDFKNPVLKLIGNTPEEISSFLSASLIDCYWIKPEDISITWEDVNYFTNKPKNIENLVHFSDEMYKYNDNNDRLKEIVIKNKYKNFVKYFTLNSDGNYCIVKNCDIFNNGIDVFNELIANIIEDALDIDGAQYYLTPYSFETENKAVNIPLISCELNIQDDTEEMLTLDKLMASSSLNPYEFLTNFGFKEDVNKLIVLDYLLLNCERSLDNIAIIRDANTLAYKRIAPIYDCGGSFNYKTTESENFLNAFYDIAMPFLQSHERQIKLVNDFSFVDFEALEEALQIIEAIISYSSLNNEQQNKIVNSLKIRINQLKDEIENQDKNVNPIQFVRAADRISKRFNVDELIVATGVDPILNQSPRNLFINFLSDYGKNEFSNYDTNNPNLKDRFEKYKKEILFGEDNEI